MKVVSLSVENTTLKGVLNKARKNRLVFLTEDGEVQFAVARADDFDREVSALRNNPEFMAYLAESKKQAHAGPRKTLDQMRELYDKRAPKPRNRRKKRNS